MDLKHPDRLHASSKGFEGSDGRASRKYALHRPTPHKLGLLLSAIIGRLLSGGAPCIALGLRFVNDAFSTSFPLKAWRPFDLFPRSVLAALTSLVHLPRFTRSCCFRFRLTHCGAPTTLP